MTFNQTEMRRQVMSMFRTPALVFMLLLGGVTSSHAENAWVSGFLAVEAGWARASPPGVSIGGGFLTIENASGIADRLVGIESPRAEKVELHETVLIDDVAQMRPVTGGLEIPDGGKVVLAPGSLHLMFVGLTEPLREGSTIPISLVFEKAGRLETELVVLPLGSPGPIERRPAEQ